MTSRSTPPLSSSGSSSPKEVLGIRAQELLSKAGGAVENIIGRHIETTAEAPLFDGAPVAKVWYRLPLSGAMSGDGSEYHIYIKKGFTSRLCLFFSGGGVAWNAFTAARPVTGSAVAAGAPNYYWNNLRPFTQFMNINIGITETDTARNPFVDWNFVVITYATGDFHVGRGDFLYTSEDGRQEILHFHGYENFRESMKAAVSLFPNPSKLLIAGDSAGAFAVPALSGIIADEFYPDCRDITLFSDSAQLLYKDWRQTARDIWKADKRFFEPLHTDNIFLDWYEALLTSPILPAAAGDGPAAAEHLPRHGVFHQRLETSGSFAGRYGSYGGAAAVLLPENKGKHLHGRMAFRRRLRETAGCRDGAFRAEGSRLLKLPPVLSVPARYFKA